MSKPLNQDEFKIPPATFGDGWLSKPAQDLCKIAIAFGGFDAADVVLAIHEIHSGDGIANITTVTNALQNLYDTAKAANPELYEEAVSYVKAREAELGS